MRHSFADAAHAIGKFTQGITDLLESGDPTSIYHALAGIDGARTVPPGTKPKSASAIRKLV
jgi:hypothetical protein